jgi:L-cysteine S-thiosulfotransferase
MMPTTIRTMIQMTTRKVLMRISRKPLLPALMVLASIAGCAALIPDSASDAVIAAQMKQSFSERGPAKLDRVEQNELQKACTDHAKGELPQGLRAALERTALAAVQYPSDGQWMGEFAEGEKIAQLGRGLQFSDPVNAAGGGNCYACHQLAKSELSFGNIGPSLYQYGKIRGNSEPILKYTWGKIWNAHAYNACSQMPRYGDAKILTEQQLKHLMALLLDPASPVNR